MYQKFGKKKRKLCFRRGEGAAGRQLPPSPRYLPLRPAAALPAAHGPPPAPPPPGHALVEEEEERGRRKGRREDSVA
uniref:Uncharacterized protein n=1 Tax=Oryza sativa subsp. japonica TaxID=39947 RepID=Q6ZDA8_ORYSJ|nr:hypothetical protein [Oryza sativa Japonica Group]BAC99493.1 hypothetical protein [Oryza sativa Japonica Group]